MPNAVLRKKKTKKQGHEYILFFLHTFGLLRIVISAGWVRGRVVFSMATIPKLLSCVLVGQPIL